MRTRALADTSIFIGMEAGRISQDVIARYELLVCPITLGELRFGVYRSQGSETLAARTSTFELANELELLLIDERVSDIWALLSAHFRERGRGVPVNDCWIAATAIAYKVPLLTQDKDYAGLPKLQVVQV